MPTPSAAFEVGLALALVGVTFEAATTMAGAATLLPEGATGELADRVRAQTEALKSHHRQARHHIADVTRHMTEAGLEPAAAPSTPETYTEWVEATSSAWYATLDADGANAYLVGWWLGQWTLAANVAAIAAYLSDASPEEPWLREVVASYAASLVGAVDGIQAARAEAPPAVAAALEAALPDLTAVPDPASLAPLEAAGALQEALEALDALLAQVRAGLTPG